MAGAMLRNVLCHLGRLVNSQPAKDTPDQELLTRFLTQRDEGAFAALMERHGPMVLGVCARVLRNPHDAEDACQAAFLVLARKAGTLRNSESLGSWLHGVAWRVSRKLLTSLARRRGHESSAAAEKPTTKEPEDLSWREVRRLVDEELACLPEAYKAPLVLCLLEGRTQDEAARELGWTLGALRGRLERGREKLRARLVRRGITASAAVAVAALAPGLSAAAVPPTLVVSTVNASVAMANGASLPACVSTHVAVLAREMLRPLVTKLRALTAMLAAVAVAVLGLSLIPRDSTAPSLNRPETARFADSRHLAEAKGCAWCVAFSPDGKRVAAGWGGIIPTEGRLRVWDVASGKIVFTVETPQSVRCVVFAPDGATLATAEHDGKARLRDASTGEVLVTYQGHASNIDTVSFAPDGKTLATASWDRTVKLWDVATGRDLRTLSGHTSLVFSAAFGANDTVASGCADGTARIWSAATGQTRFALPRHRKSVHWVSLSPDGNMLATASWDKTVKLWNARTGDLVATLFGHTEKLLGAAFSRDGQSLASCAGKWGDSSARPEDACPGEVIVWDLKSFQPRARIAHPDRVFGVAFAPDGTLATACWDGGIRLWTSDTLAQVALGAQPRPDPPMAPAGGEDEAPPLQRTKYPEEFKHPLKGEAPVPGLATYGLDAAACVKYEPEGLRTRLPAGHPGQRPGVGVATTFGVKGDFEITVRFEVLQEPAITDAGPATELALLVAPREEDEPDVWVKSNRNRALLSRVSENVSSLSRFVASSTTWNEESTTDKWGNEILSKREAVAIQDAPTQAKTGRLRLTRAGGFLFFHVAEGTSDQFILLHKTPFVEKDLKSVRLLASTGAPEAGFDVRFTDLHIRAESFPRMPATGRGAMPWLGIALAALAGVSLFGGAWLWMRRRRNDETVDTGESAGTESREPVAFPCAHCGKNLKARAALVGKKVKCIHCGERMPVPPLH